MADLLGPNVLWLPYFASLAIALLVGFVLWRIIRKP